MNYRDTQESLKENWDQPYDKILVEARLRGEITAEEFGKLYSELLGLDEIRDFSTMIDGVHSACSDLAHYLNTSGNLMSNNLGQKLNHFLQIIKIFVTK
ncbi:MAG: hypothetical protein WBB28_09315 [Crinalium sp.]